MFNLKMEFTREMEQKTQIRANSRMLRPLKRKENDLIIPKLPYKGAFEIAIS